jgi:hypothetical protein
MKKNSSDRMCAWVDEGCFIEGHGYRVSIVRENEPGHRPTGSWPYDGKPGQTMPYFFGRTAEGFSIEEARKQVDDYNQQLGVSKKDAFEIVSSSMFPRGKRRGAARSR